MSGLVKICGISRPEHAEAAALAGADLIGFVFAESRRRVSPDTAREASEHARHVDPTIRTVGLFVDAGPDAIRAVHETAGMDMLQLHGMPTGDMLAELGLPTIVVVKDVPGQSQIDLFGYIDELSANPFVELILLDAYHPTLAGGTGTVADWGLAAEVASRVPLMLAGGLTPQNVGNAIARVRPHAVDVSSGTERAGIKDPALIASFISNAREAFARLDPSHSMSSGTSSQDAP